MAIEYRTGDLLTAPCKVIAHGCNARGRFGKGVALAIREAYPDAYEAYYRKFLESGLSLGEIVHWISDSRVVLNCITQANYGNDGAQYVDYDRGIRKVFQTIEKAARGAQNGKLGAFSNETLVAIPKIGAGLAGGDWSVIEKIILEEVVSIDVLVYELPTSA